MNVRRKITAGVIIIVCFLLQTTVFDALSFAGIKPNLMVIVTASYGFMRGKKSGMFVGFFSGLLTDIIFGNVLGFYALILMLVGYCNGFLHRLFFEDDIKLPIVLISVSDFLYGLVIYIAVFLLKGDFAFSRYLLHIILPEVVYTVLITLILYPVILRLNKRMDAQEQRSASKFV